MLAYIETDNRVIRPINFSDSVPGHGFAIHQALRGNILVICAMGQTFMNPLLDNPFIIVSNFLKAYNLGKNNVKAIIVDMHAEATSEKIAMAYHLDGLVSLVVGTHTHVPTGDERILPQGTAFFSDAGMCGDYDSIIGFPVETLANRYLKKIPLIKRPDPTQEPGTLCGVYLETDDLTGLATRIHPVRLGPILSQTWPSWLEFEEGDEST
jgi:metallophosphoesterase (TIGR00282 family)